MIQARVAAVAVLGLALIGGPAVVATASVSTASASTESANTASADAAVAATGQSGPVVGGIVRFNVGATHSPQLDHLLAGSAATTPVKTRAKAGKLPAAAGADLPAADGASGLQGIDVASEQHPGGKTINWSQVDSAGYQFAFIKVSEGSYYVNPYYASDTAQAQGAGMLTAPYAFAIPNYSGGALQADYAVDNAHYTADGKLLPLILDIEYDPYDSTDGTNQCYGLSTSQMVSWISAFVTEAERRTGQSPVIYSTQGWWNACTADSTSFAANDPLWIAAYGVSAPEMPAAWANWTYWQYTDAASVPSISGSVDASYLSSSALELAAPGTQSDATGSTAGLQVNGLNGTAAAASFSATGLPGGTSIDATSGAVSGTLPATAASFPVSVTATAGTATASRSFTWAVHGKTSLGKLSSRTGSVGGPVRFQVPASDGVAGCTLKFSASGLPRGLAISSCGMITGWPSLSGTSHVTVTLTDSSGAKLATGTFSWRISPAADSGPSGQLKLRRDGKCLTERSSSDIAIEPCSSASDEHWTVPADGTIRIHGECLAASSSKSGVDVDLISCSKGGQRWQLGSNAVLTDLSNGHCLADTGSSNGSRVRAASCQATSNKTGSASTPSTSQQWTLPAGALTGGIAGYCASDQLNSGQAAGSVTIRTCKNQTQQRWTFEPDGAISIGGKCLSTASGSTAPGTQLRLAACKSSSAIQVWQLSGGPMGVQLVSPVAGLCVADPGDRPTGGTLLEIGPCVSTDPGTYWRAS